MKEEALELDLESGRSGEGEGLPGRWKGASKASALGTEAGDGAHNLSCTIPSTAGRRGSLTARREMWPLVQAEGDPVQPDGRAGWRLVFHRASQPEAKECRSHHPAFNLIC